MASLEEYKASMTWEKKYENNHNLDPDTNHLVMGQTAKQKVNYPPAARQEWLFW